ncbi:hypothetical protein Cgig2_013584 [Carnegiea gigantea]|uniref:Uncharacterized protein n=1 Tax=Carnegiea gigantea TaxID=171969 RepID=A0A9Q1KB17_9CARY|nr:hypothetical protein Cgig2_013584 [Carnegiea gigantea]
MSLYRNDVSKGNKPSLKSKCEKKSKDIVQKRKATKKKSKKPLTKKEKRHKSHEEVGKGGKSTQKSGEKEVLNESLQRKGRLQVRMKDLRKLLRSPKRKGKLLPKPPTKLEKKELTEKAEKERRRSQRRRQLLSGDHRGLRALSKLQCKKTISEVEISDNSNV